MEYLWLALFIVSTTMVTYKGITESWDKWYAYYLFPVICLIWYFIRRKRKAQEPEVDE